MNLSRATVTLPQNSRFTEETDFGKEIVWYTRDCISLSRIRKSGARVINAF